MKIYVNFIDLKANNKKNIIENFKTVIIVTTKMNRAPIKILL